jgi:uncharacterized protein YdhG (YjbR/CyaY superfamily)
MRRRKDIATIDEYIQTFPSDTQVVLQAVRRAIREAAPGAVEAISYRIPTFKLDGKYLVYFAGYDRHVGVYPAPKGDAAFQKKIAPYRSGKATIRFALDEPIPHGLLREIVLFRTKERLEKKKEAKKK